MRRPRHPGLLVLCLAASLAACAPRPEIASTRCPAALGAPVLVFELFFGRSIPSHGDVSDRAWEGFVDRIVTPELPMGFTAYDATGAWMNPNTRKTIQEHTKVLEVALPDTADSVAAIQRIRSAYQLEFHQQLVGMTVTPGCASF